MKNASGNALDITGVWILLSSRLEDAQTGESLPWPDSKGVLTLHPDGRMMALVTPVSQAVANTDAEKAAAFQNTAAYSGRYRLEPPDRLVTIVQFCLWPSWVGTEQVRTFKLTGDKLDIISAPMKSPVSDLTVIGVLSWERERSAAL